MRFSVSIDILSAQKGADPLAGFGGGEEEERGKGGGKEGGERGKGEEEETEKGRGRGKGWPSKRPTWIRHCTR